MSAYRHCNIISNLSEDITKGSNNVVRKYQIILISAEST